MPFDIVECLQEGTTYRARAGALSPIKDRTRLRPHDGSVMAHLFASRLDAAHQLVSRLQPLAASWHQPMVLALVRGGVPIGASVAKALKCSWEPMLVRKVGAPGQPEVAWGAVGLGMDAQQNWSIIQVLNQKQVPAVLGDEVWIQTRERERHQELMDLRKRYALPDRPLSLEDRTAIVVDDGVATGCSLRVAITAARSRRCCEVILAVPVAPRDVWPKLRELADGGVCLIVADHFVSVSTFYAQFPDVEDSEVQRWIHP